MIDTRMPWGKHRGRLLTDVPAGYLASVLEECDLDGWLRRAIGRELVDRLGLDLDQPSAPVWAVPPEGWLDVLKQWRRELVMAHHPDRGGNTERMQVLNAAFDRLHETAALGPRDAA